MSVQMLAGIGSGVWIMIVVILAIIARKHGRPATQTERDGGIVLLANIAIVLFLTVCYMGGE